MIDVASIIAPIVARDGWIRAVGGRVRFHVDGGLTQGELADLKLHKEAIVAALAEPFPVSLPDGSVKCANPMDEAELWRHLKAEGWLGADELPERGVAA